MLWHLAQRMDSPYTSCDPEEIPRASERVTSWVYWLSERAVSAWAGEPCNWNCFIQKALL